jgi:hypothetical protein
VELWADGFVTGSTGNNTDEYVHLDNDDLDSDELAYLELPTDKEAAEAATEQRVLMASYET